MDSDETYLTPDELAARLRKSPTALAADRTRGIGPPYIRLSAKVIRYPLSAVVEFERRNLVTPGTR
jgi:hypothetical protein